MALQIDQFSLGAELWSVGEENGWQLKLFNTHPCFMVLLSLRGGLEVDRGYITSRIVSPLIAVRHQIAVSQLAAQDGQPVKLLRLIPLQESVVLKVYKTQAGLTSIQLVDLDVRDRAITWRGADQEFFLLAEIIRRRSWISSRHFG